MARYRRVNIDGQSLYKPEPRAAPAALLPAPADTDSVIGYSQDDATIAASTTDFIRVRMRVGTVAAPATGGGE